MGKSRKADRPARRDSRAVQTDLERRERARSRKWEKCGAAREILRVMGCVHVTTPRERRCSVRFCIVGWIRFASHALVSWSTPARELGAVRVGDAYSAHVISVIIYIITELEVG